MSENPTSQAAKQKSARALKETLERLSEERCGCLAFVSEAGCRDVIEHHERDLRKLAADHDDGVHPTKHIGYLVFWVRKLKPIAVTYRISDVIAAGDGELPAGREVASDNEIISVFLAEHLLLSYVQDGIILSDLPADRRAAFRDRLVNFLRQVLSRKADVGSGIGNTFEAFVYDMRYRTFGPHHVVHFLNHIIFAAIGGA